MFGKNDLSLGMVYDTVTIREGSDKLVLHVNGDPNRMVAGLEQARKQLLTINEETSDEERREIALFFAGVIFGEDQAKKLLDFYHEDGSCVVGITGKYFSSRLSKIITKAQKKQLK